jgi:hypothetical protein
MNKAQMSSQRSFPSLRYQKDGSESPKRRELSRQASLIMQRPNFTMKELDVITDAQAPVAIPRATKKYLSRPFSELSPTVRLRKFSLDIRATPLQVARPLFEKIRSLPQLEIPNPQVQVKTQPEEVNASMFFTDDLESLSSMDRLEEKPEDSASADFEVMRVQEERKEEEIHNVFIRQYRQQRRVTMYDGSRKL